MDHFVTDKSSRPGNIKAGVITLAYLTKYIYIYSSSHYLTDWP